MERIEKQAAQGDCLFRRIKKLPEGLKEVPIAANERGHVVAHSETGHHHIVTDKLGPVHHYSSSNPLLDYLSVPDAGAEVLHLRDHDTHAPLMLSGGSWEVRRQREYVPEGWRRVED